MQLRVATYNIHKGFSQLNRRLMVEQLPPLLNQIGADVFFLQEVLGAHFGHARRRKNWPSSPQYELLAGSYAYIYACNASYKKGHHGNTILSRFPIHNWENEIISAHRFERRGLLHAEISLPDIQQKLHCICAHFGLLEADRRKHLALLSRRIRDSVPADSPLIIAGDFNDWLQTATPFLTELGLQEIFKHMHGQHARTFPARLPILCLDRIYSRGLHSHQALQYSGLPWTHLSDHLPLAADFLLGA